MEDKPDETPSAGPSSSGGSRKRPAPTIDLTATDVTEPPTPSATTDDAASSASQKKGWRSRFAGAKPEPEDVSQAKPDSSEPVDEAVTKQDTQPRARTAIIAALSGAAAALVVSGGWFAFESNLSTHEADAVVPAQTLAIDALNTRLAKLETKPAPVPVARDDEKMQSAIASLASEVTSLRKEVGSLRGQLEAVSANLASLKSTASDGGSSQAALDGITDRLSKLERSADILSQQKPVAPAEDDTPLRRAVIATTLDQSVSQGAAYAAPLAVAAKFDGDAEALKPLQAFAATGIPSASDMSRELLGLLKRLDADRAPVPTSATWLDRLKASVAGLVRITRADPSGTDRAALLVRAKIAAQREDLAEAMRIAVQLPEQDRLVLKDWIEKAKARDAALAAARQFAQQAMAALPKSSPGDAR